MAAKQSQKKVSSSAFNTVHTVEGAGQSRVINVGISFQGLCVTRLEEVVVYTETNDSDNERSKYGNECWDIVPDVDIKVPSNVPQEDHECVFNKCEDVKWYQGFNTSTFFQLEVKKCIKNCH